MESYNFKYKKNYRKLYSSFQTVHLGKIYLNLSRTQLHNFSIVDYIIDINIIQTQWNKLGTCCLFILKLSLKVFL